METEEVVISRASMKQKIVEEEDRSGSRRVSDPGTTSTSLGDSDLACLRKKFPFLADFSDPGPRRPYSRWRRHPSR